MWQSGVAFSVCVLSLSFFPIFTRCSSEIIQIQILSLSVFLNVLTFRKREMLVYLGSSTVVDSQ